MKKKLEADLISIAHRILQLKDKSDINQLYLETQKLYEKLAVLRFVENYFGEPKPTIGQAEVVEKMKEFFETISVPEFQKPAAITDPMSEEDSVVEVIEEKEIISVVEETKEEEITAIAEEEIPTSNTVETLETAEEAPVEKPLFSLDETEIQPIEPAKPETPKKKEAVQISFDDLLGGHYTDPDFVKVPSTGKKQEADSNPPVPSSFDIPEETTSNAPQTEPEKTEPKTVTLNDKLAKEINIGLNDRIAFVKHLFGGNNEDYNRVISQLITFDTYLETKTFIDEMVKPDYNNWEGKDEYEARFMEIIEKKFLSF
ncbi:hypothetical protein [Flavobacterium aquiphilum]|uniref:hypothetical protein n=1 Tax=Flavobacterium aquiphilum TaxID=3003261 RepID=UPI00247FD793|nr:hypothetical protein [Flavobacterium aquiphilum]